MSSNRSRHSARRALVWFLAAWLPISSLGCSRAFWRKQADRDSYEAIRENLDDPRWAVPRIDITPDPRSRFYDPYSPDYPPLPPDDPHAHVYMHWVDGWQGYKCWHDFGDLVSVENPQWLAPFGLKAEDIDPETGQYTMALPEIQELTLCEALELALIHNREYQTQLEIVFLRALEVTAERYQFSVRYLGPAGRTPGVGAMANFSPDGGTDSVTVGSNFGVSQFLPSGGTWFVELVNNTIWLFDGPNQTQTASALAFGLTQPLLFQAGRKVILENLTQSERNLLYAVRDLARFRQEFFTDVVSAYLNLMQQLQVIRNTERNIELIEEQVEIQKAVASQRPEFLREPLAVLPPEVEFPESLRDLIRFDPDPGELVWRGPMTEVQSEELLALSDDTSYRRAIREMYRSLGTETVTLDVLQLQSQLANTVNQLRTRERALQDSLDEFKILLGLRTDFLISLDDKLLEQFQFQDERLRALDEGIDDFIPYWGQLDADEPDPELLLGVAQRLLQILEQVQDEGLWLVREDFGRLEKVYQQRMAAMETPEDRARLEYDVQRDRRLFDDASFNIDELRQEAERIVKSLQSPTANTNVMKQTVTDIKTIQEDLITYIGTLQAVQIGLRVELVTVQDFEMSMEQAVAFGLENRVDLKNERAFVMDARRKVEVAANALQANLDLVAEGQINTSGPGGNTNPFEFRGDISDLRVGVAFDSPLDLNQERNIYRAALIDYQRARRAYMEAEDRVKQEIRDAWRQMAVIRRNLETTRQSTRIAAAQFDSATAQAYAPADPGQGAGGGRSRGGGAGLSGNNLQRALNDILNAQNNMIQFWVSYEQNRLNIYRDMGIMEVGPDNVWNDPYYRNLCGGENGLSPEGGPGTDELAKSPSGDTLEQPAGTP